jgi:hypothetical protein
LGTGAILGVKFHSAASMLQSWSVNKHQPIRSYTITSIGNLDGQLSRIVNLLLKAVDVDVVISDSVHFGKLYAVILFLYDLRFWCNLLLLDLSFSSDIFDLLFDY